MVCNFPVSSPTGTSTFQKKMPTQSNYASYQLALHSIPKHAPPPTLTGRHPPLTILQSTSTICTLEIASNLMLPSPPPATTYTLHIQYMIRQSH